MVCLYIELFFSFFLKEKHNVFISVFLSFPSQHAGSLQRSCLHLGCAGSIQEMVVEVLDLFL